MQRRQIPLVPAPRLKRSGARAQLAVMLANATPERFEHFSVDSLARTVKVPRDEIRAMLYDATIVRQMREKESAP